MQQSDNGSSDAPMTVGVVGLGLLGRGIVACCLGHGLKVVGFARSEESHAAARKYIAQAIEDLIERGGFPESLRDVWESRFTPVTTFEPFAPCGFVIESVLEDPQIKRDVFDALENVVGEDVPIASNTSALPISALQGDRRNPARFLGMHWAEPSHATRFLELIRGEQTCDEAFEAAETLARRVGKDPSMVQQDVPGFIVNRIGYAIYREAMHLVDSGVADIETVDRSFQNAVGLWATMCGPFRWMDLTGGPAAYARAIRPVFPTLCNDTELPDSLEKRAAANERGIIDGNGFYQYTPQEAEELEERFRDHAWNVRDIMNRLRPLPEAQEGVEC